MVTNFDDAPLPDIAIPPGELLQEELECRGITDGEFARRVNITHHDLKGILLGKKAISQEVADAIERELGISANMWLRMEARYQLVLSRLTEQGSASHSADMAAITDGL